MLSWCAALIVPALLIRAVWTDPPLGTSSSLIVQELETMARAGPADIVIIGEANAGRLVVILPPLLTDEVRVTDPQPTDILQDLADLAADRGVGWLDDRHVDLAPADFGDEYHLNLLGTNAFTDLVAHQLQALGALDDGPIRPGNRPPRVAVARTGEIPAAVPDTIEQLDPACAHLARFGAYAALGNDALAARASVLRSPLVVYQDGRKLDASITPLDLGFCQGAFTHEARDVHIRLWDGPTKAITFGFDPTLPIPVANHAQYRVDGFWIYPGTTLTWTFSEPWHPLFVEAGHAEVGYTTPGPERPDQNWK